ncbi:MAG TPA: C40 family peptidase [Chitinophagaceae bacterium]|nr:C40 family peptidase [Chitinophagaceae bacterium]
MRTAFTGKTDNTEDNAFTTGKKETRFLSEISMPVASLAVNHENKKPETPAKSLAKPSRSNTHKNSSLTNQIAYSKIELASPLQVKYSILLNTSVEDITTTRMFEFIDEWYGTRYRLGGNTKNGIDCSAFSKYLFAAVYGLNIPRTTREQYKITDRISRTQLAEGDLLFFNTRGGISHVGIYLQNNKFVHAASSGGVMISDIFDSYWVRRFIGVGRIKEESITAAGQ